MTNHDKDILKVCIDLLQKSPKGTIIEMTLNIGTFRVMT